MTSQSNTGKIDCLSIKDDLIGDFLFIEKSTNRVIGKNLHAWIFLKKDLQRLQVIVITVFMCEENSIDLFEFRVRFCRETPWISQESFSFCFDEEAAMSEFCDFHKRTIINQQFREYPLQSDLQKNSYLARGFRRISNLSTLPSRVPTQVMQASVQKREVHFFHE